MNDCAMVTVPCLVTVAAGVLAPGHLGELTRYLPFELADDVLVSTKTIQRRVRALPSRVGIYFVLGLALIPGSVPAGPGQDDRRAGGPGPAAPVGEGAAGPAPPPRPGTAEGPVETVAVPLAPARPGVA